MDPNECYARFCAALHKGELSEANEAHADLTEWLDNGGFDPDWSKDGRREFMRYEPYEVDPDAVYVCDGELVCGHCAKDVTEDQLAIGGDGDSPAHCGYCHRPLFDTFGLTSDGAEYVLETVRRDLKAGTRDSGWRWEIGYYKGLGKPACVRDWAEYLTDNWHGLDKRDERTLELYLHFTRWAAEPESQALPANFPEGSKLAQDESAPLLWSVICDDDILGAGATASEAIEDAARQVAEWERENQCPEHGCAKHRCADSHEPA